MCAVFRRRPLTFLSFLLSRANQAISHQAAGNQYKRRNCVCAVCVWLPLKMRIALASKCLYDAISTDNATGLLVLRLTLSHTHIIACCGSNIMKNCAYRPSAVGATTFTQIVCNSFRLSSERNTEKKAPRVVGQM